MSDRPVYPHVTARVERVFHDVFGDSVRFSQALARIDEPVWTSLKHVEFIIALESEFGLRFDGSDATDMVSVAAVLDTIGRRLV